MTRSVTHVVITDNFAGVERYVSTVALATAEAGWSVRVLGGRRREMRDLLDGRVHWEPATSIAGVVLALSRRPADVVHAHMTNAEVATALVPRRHRIVATRHFAALRGRNRAIQTVTGLLARRLDVEIAISETVRVASGDPGMRVLLNPVPDLQPQRRPERTVVVAQRWEEEKRTLDAIRAFESSDVARLGWRLVIHGAGSDEASLRRAAAASPVATSIEVAGFTDDMPDALARAGMLIATAAHEPFGLTVAEAMMAGVPIVATGTGGHLETVGQVDDALLVEVGDHVAAGDAIRSLSINDVAGREAYGQRLRRWARAHLDVQQHVTDLLSAYEVD